MATLRACICAPLSHLVSPEDVLGPLELELEAAGSCHILKSELRSSVITASALNCWANSPTPYYLILLKYSESRLREVRHCREYKWISGHELVGFHYFLMQVHLRIPCYLTLDFLDATASNTCPSNFSFWHLPLLLQHYCPTPQQFNTNSMMGLWVALAWIPAVKVQLLPPLLLGLFLLFLPILNCTPVTPSITLSTFPTLLSFTQLQVFFLPSNLSSTRSKATHPNLSVGT